MSSGSGRSALCAGARVTCASSLARAAKKQVRKCPPMPTPCAHHAHTVCAARACFWRMLTHACLHFVAWLSRARAEGAPGDQMCSPGHPLPEKQGAAASIAVADELQAVEVGLRGRTNVPLAVAVRVSFSLRKCVLEVQNRRFSLARAYRRSRDIGYSWGRRAKKRSLF